MIYQIAVIILLFQLFIGLKHIKYAVYILIILTFLIPYIVKFNIGSINLNIFNISVIILTICSIKYIKKRNLAYPLLRKYLLVTIGYFLITSLFTISLYGIGFWLKNAILLILEYYIIAYCFLYIKIPEKDLKDINIILIIISIVVAIYAITNYIIQFNPYISYISLITDTNDMASAFQEEQRGVLSRRVSSTFVHPLILGQMMLLTFSYLIFQIKDKLNLIFSLLICLLLICPIILCGSRSALFPLILIPIFYLAYTGIHKLIKYVFIGLFMLPIFINMLPKEYKATAEAMIYIWDSSKSEKVGISGSSKDLRKNQIIDALAIIEDNLLFGKGNGYVKEYGSNHPEMLGYEGLLLYTLVNYGLLGTVIFISFYIFLYKYILFKAQSRIQKIQVTSLCGCYFICILLTGISYSSFSFFFLLYMLTLNDLRNKNKTINNSTHNLKMA